MKKLFSPMLVAVVAAGVLLFASFGNGNANDTTTAKGEAWVDLGLPSGLLWATCNLGATSPEEYGDYYAWGETTTKSIYNWRTYRYAMYDSNGDWIITKYNTKANYGTVDNLTTLQPSDDAATQVLGGGARIPTSTEWQEMLNNTTVEWTTVNGVNGCRLAAANGNSIFLPAAGYRYGGTLYGAGSLGYNWSASLDENGPYDARYFYFSSSDKRMSHNGRNLGSSVRVVRAIEN